MSNTKRLKLIRSSS